MVLRHLFPHNCSLPQLVPWIVFLFQSISQFFFIVDPGRKITLSQIHRRYNCYTAFHELYYRYHANRPGPRDYVRGGGGAPCTEIDFALSFGAVIVKMIDLSKTESRDFFGIILEQENSQKLHLLPKSC